MKNRILLLGLVLFTLVLSSCSPSQVLEPTLTPSPSSTPEPTFTPTITPTPIGSDNGLLFYAGVNTILGKDQANNDSYDIYSIHVDGTNPQNLTNNTVQGVSFEFPAVSPDGKKIAYTKSTFYSGNIDFTDRYASEIFIMNIDGTDVQKISSYPQYNGNDLLSTLIFEFNPSWSPDGKQLMFISNRHTFIPGNRNYDSLEIFTVDVDTYEVKQITKSQGYIAHPTWSHDGQKIAFMSNRTGSWNIFIQNADGSGKTQNITNNKFTNRFPAWSPVEDKIVFHSDMNGNIDLYTLKSDGSELTKLTNNPADDASASWSPDGKWIAFSSDRGGNFDFYLLELSTLETIQLNNNPYDDVLINWRN